MENYRFIKFLLFCAILLFAPIFVFAYSDETTHPALTDEIVDLFNFYYPTLKLSDSEKELIKKGSIDEDAGARALHHFYDPVYNRGLWGNLSSKEWSEDTLAQASVWRPLAGAITGIFGAPSDYSWDRAIYDYVWDDKERGLITLGHILHLIEDASVPDHTRNDPHPPVLDLGSPYEAWTKKFTPENIEGLTAMIYHSSSKPVVFGSLNDYFDSLATYSNNNFFSKDTIFHKEYDNPTFDYEKREILSDGNTYLFKYKNEGLSSYRLVTSSASSDWYGVTKETESLFFIDDNDDLILTDYWSHLSKQAVLHGVGVVKLFFEEVAKEKETKLLYNKNRSLAQKLKGVLLVNLQDGSIKIVDEKEKTQLKTYLKYAIVIGGILAAPLLLWDEFQENLRDNLANVFRVILLPENEIYEAPPRIVEKIPLPAEKTPPPPPAVVKTKPKKVSSQLPTPPPQLPQISLSPILPSKLPSNNENTPPPAANNFLTLIPIPPAAVGGGGGSSSSSETPKDTTGPSVSLSISECDASLSSDGCLTATTTLNLSWSSSDSDLDHYVVECEVGGTACSNFNFSNTTATSTIYTAPTDDAIYTFKAKAIDKSGNEGSQITKTAEIFTRPVVINEVAWAGTNASSLDEWIELYNRTSKSVSLSGWVLYADDGVPYLNLSGTIASGGYYLIERTSTSTVSDIDGDLVVAFSGIGSGSGLSNSGEVLILSKASTTIDQTPSCGTAWCNAGSATGFLTMERVDPDVSGTSSSNWGSHNETVRNGKDAANAALAGTARARNSLNYLITTGSTLSANKTLKKSKSPFVVKDGITINSGATLTIEPGVVIKFFTTTSSLTAAGSIKANGTAVEKIVFTSFKDDTYGGDLNGDGSTSLPLAGDWSRIELSGSGSEFDQTVIRYGGKVTSGNTSGRANLKVVSASISVKNSTIEEAGIYGMWLDGASGTVEGNTIRNNDNDSLAAGIYMTAGSPAITSNTFDANKVGLKIEPDTSNAANTSSITSNTFTSNQSEAIRASAGPTFSGNSATSNGLNGIVISGNQTNDYTFVTNLPYIIESTYTVNSGKTLTVNSGVVVKFQNSNAAIQVQGRILAEGTSASQIVFTSLKDDAHGGDTNNDSSATSPAVGDWISLTINSSAASSTFANALLRYGAACALCGGFPSGAIKIENGTLEVSNSTIEFSKSIGLWLTGSSTTTVTGTTFRSNGTGIKKDSPAVFINGGGITFESNTANTDPTDLVP